MILFMALKQFDYLKKMVHNQSLNIDIIWNKQD